jgi:hypothetical protein
MAHLEQRTVVGVFESHAKAQQAVAELQHAGFRDDQIGVIARNTSAARDTDDDDLADNFAGEGAATGIAAGAGLGALWGMGIVAGVMPVLGPAIAGGALAAILTSAAAGAAAAGLAGALIGMGLPKEEAEYYQREFHSGRVLVTVSANGRAAEARLVLQLNGGYDISTRPTETHMPPPTPIGRTPDIGQWHTAPTSGAAMTPGGQQAAPAHEFHVPTHVVDKEHRTIDVPVSREAVIVEDRPMVDPAAIETTRIEPEDVRVPVRGQQVQSQPHG